MADSIPIVEIPKAKWVDVYAVTGIAVGTVLEIQALNAGDVRLSIKATKPSDADGHVLLTKGYRMVTPPAPSGVWVYSEMGSAISAREYVGDTVPVPIALFDGNNNPISSLDGALDIHDADVHRVPVNELFHRHTGLSTTLAAPVTGGGLSPSTITVVSGVGFNDGDPIQIEDETKIEVTFPTIISGGGTTALVLDRPLDFDFAIGATIEQVATNMAVDGSATPVSFKLIPDINQTWHVVRFLLAMVHSTAADDSRFGSIIGGLQNGCILRGYNAEADQYRIFTNWKSNFDIKMDMYDLTYTDKAGGGNFGSNGRGSIRDGTGASPRLVGANNDYLELLVQDDLTGLIKFALKGQGHIEGL